MMRHYHKPVQRGMIIVIVLFFCLSLRLPLTQAAGTVTDCANYGPGAGTLQNALMGGGLITFTCSGTIIVPEITITQDTTLDATGQTVILSGNNANRVIVNYVTTQIIHLSIMNGNVVANQAYIAGAGIFNAGNLTLSDVVVAQNSTSATGLFSGYGGGLTNDAGTVTITNSQFYGNSTLNGEGGAIHNYGGTMFIDNTTIRNNSATSNSTIGGYGGGITNRDGQMTLDNVTVTNNTARSGGGIENLYNNLIINNSTLSANVVIGGGGAIMNFGSITMNNSLLDSNTAVAFGGAIQNGGSIVVTGSTFSNNAVTGTNMLYQEGYGGAIDNYGGTANITTSTFTGNMSTFSGQAISGAGPTVFIVCSNILGNGGSAPYAVQAIADARNNWWGDPSGPGGAGPGIGDSVGPWVNFSGFLAAPATSADCVLPVATPTPVPNPVSLPGVVQSPSIPLCSDLNGAVNPVVRAKLPSGVYGIYCRIIAENRQFTRTPAEVGVQSVLDEGVIHAVDVFSPSGASAAGTQICLQGAGSIVFLDAANAPRVPQTLPTTTQGGYTCVTIPNTGTVVLVDAHLPAHAPVVESAVVGDCHITTTHQVNLRSEPNTGSAIIARLAYQITLKVTARSNGFFKVIYLDGQGWVSGDYVTSQGDCGG